MIILKRTHLKKKTCTNEYSRFYGAYRGDIQYSATIINSLKIDITVDVRKTGLRYQTLRKTQNIRQYDNRYNILTLYKDKSKFKIVQYTSSKI